MIKLLPSWLRWSLRDEPQKFAIDGGVIAWQPIADGWRLDSSELKLATNDKPWPKLEFHAMETAGVLYGKLNELQLDSLLPLLPLIPGMPLEGLYSWQQLKPQGKLGPLAIYRPKDGELQAKVALERVSWQPAESIPGSTPIDLSLGWRNNFLSAVLPSQDYKLDFGDGFKAPLSFRADAFELGFSLDSQALMVPALHLAMTTSAWTPLCVCCWPTSHTWRCLPGSNCSTPPMPGVISRAMPWASRWPLIWKAPSRPVAAMMRRSLAW